MSRFLPDQEIQAIAAARLDEPASSLYWSLMRQLEKVERDEAAAPNGLWQHAYRLLNAAFLARQRRTNPPDWVVDILTRWANHAYRGRYRNPEVLLTLALSSDLLCLEPDDRTAIDLAIRSALLPYAMEKLHDPNESPIVRKEWEAALAIVGQKVSSPLVNPVLPDGSSRLPPGATYRWLLAEMWCIESQWRDGAFIPFPPRTAQAIRFFIYSVMSYPSIHDAEVVMADGRDSQSALPPPMEWLAWVASRGRTQFPIEAGLARWLLETLYLPGGMLRHTVAEPLTGFVLRLWPSMAPALSPEEAGLSPVIDFRNGFSFARPSWTSPLRCAVRHQGAHELDAETFLISYHDTVLLTDSGDRRHGTMYRKLAALAEHHNSCTFSEDTENSPAPLLSNPVSPSLPMAQKSLQSGAVSMIALSADTDTSGAIASWERIWLLAGEHLLILIDELEVTRPLTLHWHFLLESEGTDFKPVPPDRLVVRRANAGMKLISIGEGTGPLPSRETVHCYLNNETAPLACEVKMGSGTLVGWQQHATASKIYRYHVFCFDTPGAVAGWHLRPAAPEAADLIVESRGGGEVWQFKRFEHLLHLRNRHHLWSFRRSAPAQWSADRTSTNTP